LDKKAVRKAPGDIENLFSISHFLEKKKKTEIGRLNEFENRCLFLIMLDIPFLLICQLQMPTPKAVAHPG
jgi:hypothetical protein